MLESNCGVGCCTGASEKASAPNGDSLLACSARRHPQLFPATSAMSSCSVTSSVTGSGATSSSDRFSWCFYMLLDSQSLCIKVSCFSIQKFLGARLARADSKSSSPFCALVDIKSPFSRNPNKSPFSLAKFL